MRRSRRRTAGRHRFYTVEWWSRRLRTMLVAVKRRVVVGLQVVTGLYRGAVVLYVVGGRTMFEAVEWRIVVGQRSVVWSGSSSV